ncbi:MAG TPA: AMIN domain-containing protein [Nitrospiraceae bacterium]|nr:AMIN domain-containing protein [Nitrospiraceae bacterium]
MKGFLRVLSILLTVLPPSIGWTAGTDEPKLTAPSQPRSSPAHTLTHVELKQRGGEATVLISGDGRLSYRIRPLSTDRVIVDLLNVSTKLTHAFEFNDRIVRQIRIGQHPNVLRLVIDLRQAAVYSVEEGKNTLSVVLAPRADGKKSQEAAVLSPPSQASLESPADNRAAKSAVPASMQLQSERVQLAALESDRTISEPRPRQEPRNRAVDRRVVAQPTTQSSAELYVAAFGGVSLAQSFTKVHGTGDDASVQLSDLALKGTGIGGLKLGFSPGGAKWFALETEAFYSSPHIKQQTITATGDSGSGSTDAPGSYTRVATWAFNWIIRYPGEWVQPYAGAGLGIFWGRISDSPSSSDTSPGLNALAGVRIKMGQHLVAFSEYKYNRASFDFTNADLHVLYQAHYVVGGLGWSF